MDSSRVTVLVAEDDEDLAAAIAEQLDELGYLVQVARDGETALSALRLEAPAMLLIDLGLPARDGIAVAQRTRGHGATFPIIAMTGWTDPTLDARARAAGCDGVLRKPFTVAALRDAIARAFAR